MGESCAAAKPNSSLRSLVIAHLLAPTGLACPLRCIVPVFTGNRKCRCGREPRYFAPLGSTGAIRGRCRPRRGVGPSKFKGSCTPERGWPSLRSWTGVPAGPHADGAGRVPEVACATGPQGRTRPDSRLAERSPNQVRPRKQKRSVTGDGGRGVSGGTPPHLAGCSPLPP